MDLNANLQVRSHYTKIHSRGKAACAHERLYTVVTDVCAGTAVKGHLLHPDALLSPGRTVLQAEALARCKTPFSKDPLEDVLGGLSWEHNSYQDGPVGRRASSSPVIS